MSPSPLPAVWRFAIIGALVSLPITVVVNWLPDSEAAIGGGIMIFGAFIAGVIAEIRSANPGSAGLRAGVLAGVVAGLTLLVEVATTTQLSVLSVVFVVSASVLALLVASAFGLVFGRIGGWAVNIVTSRLRPSANMP